MLRKENGLCFGNRWTCCFDWLSFLSKTPATPSIIYHLASLCSPWSLWHQSLPRIFHAGSVPYIQGSKALLASPPMSSTPVSPRCLPGALISSGGTAICPWWERRDSPWKTNLYWCPFSWYAHTSQATTFLPLFDGSGLAEPSTYRLFKQTHN